MTIKLRLQRTDRHYHEDRIQTLEQFLYEAIDRPRNYEGLGALERVDLRQRRMFERVITVLDILLEAGILRGKDLERICDHYDHYKVTVLDAESLWQRLRLRIRRWLWRKVG